MMNGLEKSDSAMVAAKPTNKVERSAAESVEQRAGTKGNAGQLSTRWTQSRISVTQVLRQNTAVDTLGGSRMRESRTYGSGRGARGNSRPYREPQLCSRTLLHLLRSPSGTGRLSGHVRVDGESWRVSGPSAKCFGQFIPAG